VNATVIRHVLFTGRITPVHPSEDNEKSPLFVPVIETEILDNDALPTFARLAVAVPDPGINWLPKFTMPGARTADGTAPLPVKVIDCTVVGLPVLI
jgi:hypothetical protein